MTALDHVRSCGAPAGASFFSENRRFAGVFDSYRAHSHPLEQAETRMVACVRRAMRAGFGRAVPTPVLPGIWIR